MINHKYLALCAAMLCLAILACQVVGGPAADPDAAATAIQQTLQAQQAGNTSPGGLQPISPADLTATSIAAANQPAATPLGSGHPTVTIQSNPQATTAVPPTATPIPCDKVSFVKDVTVPDDTKLQTGSAFTKTWRLQNAGSCTWTSGYKLVFDHGDGMGGPKDVQLTTGTVAPGQTIDVSVNLTAPANPGTYQGFWKLRNPSGVLFGWGDKANSAFWVKIVVEAAAQQPPANTKKQVTLQATANSGTVASDGADSPTFLPGDDILDIAWITYLDFEISSIPHTATIHSATLDLSCTVMDGNPFVDLGELGVFYTIYGNFDPAVLSQGPSPFLGDLGGITSCPGQPLDITTSLQANLAPAHYQVVMLFQFAPDNMGDNDAIQIGAPTLKVEYTP